ncbi:hypothetical protein OIU79_001633 [Salix purpurea]|uniref:Uncharacterized protein n=1 Tax=Salix purpurea TaxID=77065 RepID=A0A9Q0UQ96_SALPP|nr:hypothetical protein OIU79_001633 [Salix purpurea]
MGSDNAQTNEKHQKQTAQIFLALHHRDQKIRGGERKGIEGIAVGIGIDGIVVGIGMVGIEGMLGSGGKVTLGRLGIVGRLGSGGSEGLGREGCVVGNVGCGRVGIEGIGGNVGLGRFGTEGKGGNCRS